MDRLYQDVFAFEALLGVRSSVETLGEQGSACKRRREA
jgi:hypothetical protein